MTTEIKLPPAEYKAMQDRIQLLASLAVGTDEDALAAFIRQAETADSIGPFLDPTMWSAGHSRLRQVIEHARALAAFRRAATK